MRGRRETKGKRTNARQKESWGGVTVGLLCSAAGGERVLWGPDNGLTVPVPAVNMLLSKGGFSKGTIKTSSMESV